MATTTLGGTPTTIDDAELTTGWTTFTTQDGDIKKQGTYANSGILRTDLSTGYYDIVTDSGSAQNMTGRHVRVWIQFTAINKLDTEAGSGMEFFMYDGTNTAYWVAFGSDTYFGGWKNFVLNCDLSPESGSFDKTIVRRWGFRFNRTAAPANVINTYVDYIRYGDGYYATGGTSGDEISLDSIRTVDIASGYGIIDRSEGVYYGYGALTIGNGATTTYFEMLNEVLVFVSAKVATGLYKIVGAGSGCNINIQNSVMRSSGSTDTTRFIFDMDDTNLATFTMNGSLLMRAGECRFKSGQDVSGNTFVDCGQILAAGADLTGSSVKSYAGAANTSCLIWDVNTDCDGYLDDMSFEKGTNAHHAIEFGTTSPTSLTLRGVSFSGFNASNSQNDSALHVKRTTGTVTISVIGCSGDITYKSEGATVVISVDPVTLSVHVQDSETGDAIVGARVLVTAGDIGPKPYHASVTITRSSSTATVSHTDHGLATNDYVVIAGANQPEYNGVHQITYSNANAYTYTVSGTPDSPATGTITSTFAPISNTTNSSGNVTDSRSYTSNQDIEGKVRMATSGTLYKTAPISGTIDSSKGLSVVVQLIPDE